MVPICVNCIHFRPSPISPENPANGRCAAVPPHPEEEYLVTGFPGRTLQFCSVARMRTDLCGRAGRLYEEKPAVVATPFFGPDCEIGQVP